jgi:hypothetical protein
MFNTAKRSTFLKEQDLPVNYLKLKPNKPDLFSILEEKRWNFEN